MRVNPTDWGTLIAYQSDLRSKVLPPGSNFTIEMFFNGAGGAGVAALGVVSVACSYVCVLCV